MHSKTEMGGERGGRRWGAGEEGWREDKDKQGGRKGRAVQVFWLDFCGVRNAGSLTKNPPSEGLSYFPKPDNPPEPYLQQTGPALGGGGGGQIFCYLIGVCQAGGLAFLSVPLGKATFLNSTCIQ